MKKVLIVGGSSGLGLALVIRLINRCDTIFVADCNKPNMYDVPKELRSIFEQRINYIYVDLFKTDISILQPLVDIVDGLIITAGFGRVADFNSLYDCEVSKLIRVNMESPIRIIKLFSKRIYSDLDFFSMVIGSISGHITSPLLSVYSASKTGLCSFIKNFNVELIAQNKKNRILDVSPSSFNGSSFNGAKNKVEILYDFADCILKKMFEKEIIYIPNLDTFKSIMDRDHVDPISFGLESYQYKITNKRINDKKQFVVGYLSGTFDLFHIGHLNLLRRAKEHCDYLIVGVHESGAWKGKETFIPFSERLEIIKSIKYVNEADKSFDEDSDAWEKYHFDKLFVGSDYKGSERFKRYEHFFKDKNVEIIYFPYTKGTSSTQLRKRLAKKEK